jgi:hypothetical protein
VSLVRYDNETGEGDHRHYGDREEPYGFSSVEQLLADLRNDSALVEMDACAAGHGAQA